MTPHTAAPPAPALNIPRVAALLTCFNRREKTLGALQSIFSQRQLISRQLSVYLVDDNSTDGTAQAVAASFPEVILLGGTGSLFWNGGMRIAFAEAMRRDFDYYLWVNDDTHLDPSALDLLLGTAQALEQDGKQAIVVGSTLDPARQSWTYGGVRRDFLWGAVRLTTIHPSGAEPLPCDTMNGNCTLIPRAVVRKVGNLDPAFRHAIGDFDYGFRARSAGFEIYVAPEYVGTCAQNSNQGTWRDRNAPFPVRWRNLVSIKGLPFREWALYTRRHYGALWPLYTISPYVKTILGAGLRSSGFESTATKAL